MIFDYAIICSWQGNNAIKHSPTNKKVTIMLNIKKSLLFTVYIVDNRITCVRCNITGRFVKRSIYLALHQQTNTANGVCSEFNLYSLGDMLNGLKTDYSYHKTDYAYDTKMALFVLLAALPIIFIFGQVFKLIVNLIGA